MLTNSLVLLGYNLAMLACLGHLYAQLRWLGGGGAGWLVAGGCMLSASLLVNEGALVSIVLLPLLLAAEGRRPGRRLAAALAVWALSLTPHLVLFLRFLADRQSYARVAFTAMTLEERIARTAGLFAENFAPWRWVWERPRWIRTEPAASVLPGWVMAAAAVIAAALLLLALWRRRAPGPVGRATARDWRVTAALLALALLSNAAFSGIILSAYRYRTQPSSRVWVSLALAAAVALPRWRPADVPASLLLPTAFVALGAAGGVERQDYYAATWAAHREELTSILEQVPALAPSGRLILHLPGDRVYQATEVLYLTQSWATLLYDDRSMGARSFLWAGHEAVGCRAESTGFGCWHQGQREEFLRGEKPGWHARYEDAVVLTFDAASGRYRLLEALPDPALLAEHPAMARYRPRCNLRPASPSARTRALLPPALRLAGRLR